MKKRSLFFILLTIMISVFLFQNKKTESEKQLENLDKKLALPLNKNDLLDSSKKQTELSNLNSIDQVNRNETEFKKCFKKELSDYSEENLIHYILKFRDFGAVVIAEENYELIDLENKKIIVQYFPQEDEINKVRVFLINPQDGLPDRIKEFPFSNSDTANKLKGALTLGRLNSKNISTQQVAYDGTMLSLDKESDKIIRTHLIAKDFEFECKTKLCICLKKE